MKPVILFKKKIKPGINPDLECLIDNHFSYNRKHNFEWQCWLIFPLKKKKLTSILLSSLICEMREFVWSAAKAPYIANICD